MERSVTIRKKKSSLITACLETAVFSMLALLFWMYPAAAGSLRIPTVIFLLAVSLAGWYMIIDYFRSCFVISEEGITDVRPFAKPHQFTWAEITSVAESKNMIMVYGKNNKVLASLDAPLSAWPEAVAILRDHQVELHDHYFRRKKS